MDITDIKQEDEEREALQKQIQHSQNMHLLGQLADGIAHDINNVLVSIYGNIGFILNETSKSDPHYQNLLSVITSVNRSANMIKQLLAFA